MSVLEILNDDKTFEYFCRDFLLYSDYAHFELYGTNGQKQNGIDLYKKISSGNIVAAQCKYYFGSSKKFIKEIKKDFDSIKSFISKEELKITEVIVLTSIKRDVEIQTKFMKTDEPFSIKWFFREDIENRLYKSPELLQKYFSDLIKNLTIDFSTLNEIISLSRTIQNYVTFIYGSHVSLCDSGYWLLSTELYNVCADFYQCVIKLHMIETLWHIQLLKQDISFKIRYIVDNLPEFYGDATGLNANLDGTIINFKDYFDKKENFDMYMDMTSNIILLCEQYYPKKQ